MRIVIAPDKFKGCLSAPQVAAAMAAGVRRVGPDITIEEIPVADGGEGTVDTLVAITGGRLMTARVTGPLPDMQVEAAFGILGNGTTAVIEMAAASGLALLRHDQHDPMKTTTYGTGELLLVAARAGARRIILGIGGSATVDGGVGCAQACGVRFDVDRGVMVGPDDPPLTGAAVVYADPSKAADNLPAAKLRGIEVMVACDVNNPLIGPRGAACVFGPQKGATREQVQQLDRALENLSLQVPRGCELRELPGAGAAGGLGFGMMAFFGATLRPGFEIVAETVGLRDRIVGADLVLTGEGRLDASSLGGKTAIGVARLCRTAGIPCVGLVGVIGTGGQLARCEGMTAIHSISDPWEPLARAIAEAPQRLTTAAERAVRSALRTQ
jgi:glycerate kinase